MGKPKPIPSKLQELADRTLLGEEEPGQLESQLTFLREEK